MREAVSMAWFSLSALKMGRKCTGLLWRAVKSWGKGGSECSGEVFGGTHLPFGTGGSGSSYRIFSTNSDTISEKNGGFPEITRTCRISLSSTLIPNLSAGIPGNYTIINTTFTHVPGKGRLPTTACLASVQPTHFPPSQMQSNFSNQYSGSHGVSPSVPPRHSPTGLRRPSTYSPVVRCT